MSLTFPPSYHMKTPAEFERCYARKRSASDGLLLVFACENDRAHPRLGCSVSKKVGNAVVRNRYKRLFREAFRHVQHDLPPGLDLILIPRPGPYPPLEGLKASLLKLAAQAARKLGERRPTPPAPLPKGKGEEESRSLALAPNASAVVERSDTSDSPSLQGGGRGVGPTDGNPETPK